MNQTKIPQYRQLYETLRRHILAGTYEEGSLLPSENELCTVHSMTRPTVRHALDSLVRDGFITRRQGKGSIVRRPPLEIGILSIAATSSAINRNYLKTQILKKPVIVPWPDNFPYDLSDAEKVSGCINMERLRFVNDQPVFYDINHLPNINLPRFATRSLENKSLFDTLRQHYHIEVKGGEQKLRAIKASSDISKLLHVPPDAPVLYLERKLITNRDGFHIYSSIWFNSDKYAICGTF
ncbi:MAG: GntR family transcriptional regulator [Tannerella sp.]|jgi:GntR family transcriptional regulator/GntR family frlABCD operon transcriptional regulator|nr:GntR family transcriptional regulator [Tannerella sp.]